MSMKIERQRQAVAPRPAPFTLEEFEELFVVGDGGQRILRAEPLQLDARRFELGGASFERASRAPRPARTGAAG